MCLVGIVCAMMSACHQCMAVLSHTSQQATPEGIRCAPAPQLGLMPGHVSTAGLTNYNHPGAGIGHCSVVAITLLKPSK